ncbi:hypothetical protein ACFLV7_04505 [Chloroflexota bacterium]
MEWLIRLQKVGVLLPHNHAVKMTWRLGEKTVSVFASGGVELMEVLIQAAQIKTVIAERFL